jgi:hypothetical protein
MTQRERVLSMTVAGAVLLGGGAFVFVELVVQPLRQRATQIKELENDIAAQDKLIDKGHADQALLDRWRKLSLPPETPPSQDLSKSNHDPARREYAKYLEHLMTDSGFAPGSYIITPKTVMASSSVVVPGKKTAIYLPLSFLVSAQGSLENLVKMLEDFYHTGLLHKISYMSLQMPQTPAPDQKPGELVINMTVEALVIASADNKPYVYPNIDRGLLVSDLAATFYRGPVGLGWALWAAGPTGPLGPRMLATPPRHYAALAGKNIFTDPPEGPKKIEVVEVTRFVYLTDIVHSDKNYEASLYDQFNGRETRLSIRPGYDQFMVRNNTGATMVRAKVVHIEARDLIFQMDDQYYAIHVGQNIKDALSSPIPPEKLDSVIKQRGEAALK